MSPFTLGFTAPLSSISPSSGSHGVGKRHNPLMVNHDPSAALNGWLSRVWWMCDGLRHNDNAVCILGIVAEIANEEANGLAAMITRGRELLEEFTIFLATLIREESALSGAALVKCVREVFDVQPVVFLPSPAPLKHNPLLDTAPAYQGALL